MYVGDSKQQQRETGNKDKERPQTVTGIDRKIELSPSPSLETRKQLHHDNPQAPQAPGAYLASGAFSH
jgi:hypothetical protein